MNNNIKYNHKKEGSKGLLDEQFLANCSISWKKNKDDIWASMEQKMETSKKIKTIPFHRRLLYPIAAVLILCIGVIALMRLYTKTIETDMGEHMTVTLPDGSAVDLNAASTISWHPYWWKIERNVCFNGEGFFMVKKGSAFTVTSTLGETTVLGTSFNVFARNQQYRVTCLTGKVKVLAQITNQQIIVNPGEKATLENNGTLIISANVNTQNITGWRNHMFTFTATDLSEVLEEISRQYNSIIHYKNNDTHVYTGNFSRSMDLENVLNLVCRPFDLNFAKEVDGSYIIIPNSK